MPRPRLFIALAAFSVLFVLGQFLFVPKTASNSAILTALSAPRVFFSALRSKHKLITQLQDLTLENHALRGQLSAALALPGLVTTSTHQYVRAVVYSSYPNTNAKSLVIGVGSEEGITPGLSVVVKPGLFVGEVVEVSRRQSVVKTLFDTAGRATSTPWQLSVKIGKSSTDSLLIADLEPRLTIISRKKTIVPGDTVTLAGRQYPFGLSAGTVGEIIDNPSNVFLEATLNVPYSIAELNEVFVMLPQ